MNRIRIDFTFWLFNAILFMYRDSLMVLTFYIACLVHELAHIVSLRLCGGELYSIEVSCFGIRMRAAPFMNKRSGLIVLLSGPIANLLTSAVLYMLGIWRDIALFSLAEGVFNLLPFSFLDGGAAVDLFCDGIPNEPSLRKALGVFHWALVALCAISIFIIVNFAEK